jgi:hypothetical protein
MNQPSAASTDLNPINVTEESTVGFRIFAVEEDVTAGNHAVSLASLAIASLTLLFPGDSRIIPPSPRLGQLAAYLLHGPKHPRHTGKPPTFAWAASCVC